MDGDQTDLQHFGINVWIFGVVDHSGYCSHLHCLWKNCLTKSWPSLLIESVLRHLGLFFGLCYQWLFTDYISIICHFILWHFYQWHFYLLAFLPPAFLPFDIFTTGIITVWHFYYWHFYHLAYLPMTFLPSGIFTNGIFTIWHIYQWHFYHLAFSPMAFLPMAILPMAFLSMAFVPTSAWPAHTAKLKGSKCLFY